MVRKRTVKKKAVRSRARARGTSRPREEVKQALEVALRKEFPDDTVDISDGYQDNIHVLVVSRRFDPLSEQEKQDLLWGIIDATDLTKDEKVLISLVLPYSPSEIK